MFFREKKSGSARLLQLVENHRNAEGKVCQRVVVSLGGCPVPDEHRKRVAAEITHRMAGYPLPGLYQNYDAGTGKYIYNIGLPFSATGMTVGPWKNVSGDVLPHIKTAFTNARAAGALTYSGNLADYKIGGMNMGWEVPGLSRVEMQVKNLSLTAVQTNRSLIVTTPYGSPSPSGTNSYPDGTVLTARLAGSPVVNGATQYVCKGWKANGDVVQIPLAAISVFQ